MEPIIIDAINIVSRALEALGILVIAMAAAYSTIKMINESIRNSAQQKFLMYRQRLGKGILLGLEFLVAADIIRTVAIKPTLTSVAVLAAIVAIRTFLSFTLEIEMTGKWPWQNCRK